MKKKTAFLFPGQGSQSIGMLSGLAEQCPVVGETFRTASDVLGFNLWNVCQDGPVERLNQTEVTQPAMLAAGIATWRAWKSLGGFNPDCFAGHSLGEYSALVAAGSLEFADALALVAERGRLMQFATPEKTGAMAAVLGLEDDILADICAAAAQGQVVSCANFNSPGQIVIAGDKAAVERACQLATEAGARRTIPLAVSVPSHCALMQSAAEKLFDVLAGLVVVPGKIPVIHNVDVKVHNITAHDVEVSDNKVHNEADGIRDALVRQLSQPVRWAASIQTLIGDGITRFAECGPGKVLTGLNRRISRDVSSVALITRENLAETLANWS
ncbi:MAG: ACP S-malonyltransferase [Proteobacteria bacterium]|nr:ACP S-malonyltransferase [Pseudomonadota bacterium]